MKIRPVGDRTVPCTRTDMTTLIFVFRNFADAPKRGIFCDCFEEVPEFRVLNLDTCLGSFLFC